MAQETPSHQLPEIVQNRPVAYEALFEGELPYNPLPAETDIGLAGYWRAYSEKKGRHGDTLQGILDGVEPIVARALREHDSAARSGNPQAEAVFGLVDPQQSLPVLINITSSAMRLWEKALYRSGHARLLASDQPKPHTTDTKQQLDQAQAERMVHLLTSKGLIVETAAAAMQCLPEFTNKPLSPTKADQANIAKLLANWGPQFVTEWMDGTILDKWLTAQAMSSAEQASWRDIFTPALRKYFAVHNITDPLQGLEQVKTNLETKLTDAAIAGRLGWDEDTVRDIFSPALRKRFAVGNIADPLQGLEQVKTNLETKLTDAAIAERLGWDEADVQATFNPALRKRFAVYNITDPLQGLEQVKTNLETKLTDAAIAERLGWDEDTVRDIFSPALRKHFAVGNIADPLQGVQDYIEGKISVGGRYYDNAPQQNS